MLFYNAESRSDLHLNPDTIFFDPDGLDVGVLHSLGDIMGMTDGITKHRALTTYFAYS